MRKSIILIIPIISFTLICSGCAKKPDPRDKVLAKVSNEVITEKDLKAKIAKLPPYYQNVVSKNPKKYIEDMVFERLCYEEGVRYGLDRDKEVKELINEAKKKIIMAKLIKNEVDDKVVITEPEMAKFYEAYKDKFKTPGMWRASHILVSDEKEAKAVSEELAGGAKFEDLAMARSTDATASRGGDVGYFRAGQLIPDFERACLKLDVGQTSGIVPTQFGYHIIKLTDKKSPGVQSYQEAKRAIEAEIRKQKQGELFNALVLRLKNKYGVEVNENL
ncbi:MAG: peptidyl-prolyl cis-trans isomerase [Candidatus Omnitrophota bacterium]|nr:peptidyl-prolyl cis-trans isomerase [Candidatus Omnitrophota bacterium]